MDVWFESVLEGYIVDFIVEVRVSYTTVQRKLLKGPRGIFIWSLPLSINMIMCDHEVLPAELDNMSG